MIYTVVLGIVIVTLGAAAVVYTFWHEGSPIWGSRSRQDSVR